jgi:hypothetical protein
MTGAETATFIACWNKAISAAISVSAIETERHHD